MLQMTQVSGADLVSPPATIPCFHRKFPGNSNARGRFTPLPKALQLSTASLVGRGSTSVHRHLGGGATGSQLRPRHQPLRDNFLTRTKQDSSKIKYTLRREAPNSSIYIEKLPWIENDLAPHKRACSTQKTRAEAAHPPPPPHKKTLRKSNQPAYETPCARARDYSPPGRGEPAKAVRAPASPGEVSHAPRPVFAAASTRG